MYTGPDIVRPARGQTSRLFLPSLAAVLVLGLCLFLIVGTIVLALIPIYISSKSATLSPNNTRSQEFKIYAKLHETTLSAGRKRQTSNITDSVHEVIGGSFTSSSLTQVKTSLLSTLSGVAQDVTVTSVIIAYESPRRKRFLRTKRAVDDRYMIIKAYLTYLTACTVSCQSLLGPTIRQKLYNSASVMSFSNVAITKSGITYFVATIKAVSIDYVSEILPASGSSTQGTVPPTAFSTTVATTTQIIPG